MGDEFDPTPEYAKKKGFYTTMNQFENPAAIKKACDFARCANVSHEKAVGIGNLFLKGAGKGDLQICPNTSINIVHKSDLQRLEKLDSITKITSIYFDGKKGPAAEGRRRTSDIEVITMITEPLARYLGSFEPENGQGATIGKHLLQNIDKRQSRETIRLIGMDGTPANSKFLVMSIFH